MGAIAESMELYVQPLLEGCDGSLEQVERAYSIALLCWNLAVLPEDAREESIASMQSTLGMDHEEFENFRAAVVEPMIKRHRELFPNRSKNSAEKKKTNRITKSYQGTGRNQSCPCGSGKKYKRCCGR